jgi:hypothetical protein
MIADVALCVSFRQLELLNFDLMALYGKDYPRAVRYIDRVLRHPAMSVTEAFQMASLKGPPAERREHCRLAGAPISAIYSFGTLTTPRM